MFLRTSKLPKNFFQVLHLLRPYRKELVLTLILTFLPPYFTVWTPYLIGVFIDEGILAQQKQTFFLILFLILGCQVFLFLSRSVLQYCLSALSLNILVDYREQLLSQLLSYPMSFFSQKKSGWLTTRLTNDINSLQEFFSTALVPMLGYIFLIIGTAMAMFFINVRLAFASLVMVPCLIWLTYYFHRKIRLRFGFMRRALSHLNAFSAESFAGHRDLQVFSAEAHSLKDFDSYSQKYQKRFKEAVEQYATYNPLVAFLTSLMDVCIVGYGGWQVYHHTMTVGEIVAFLSYSAYFSGPIKEFAEKYSVFQTAMASVDRLVEMGHLESESDRGIKTLSQIDTIEFQKVGFVYSGSVYPAVQKLHFQVEPGEKIALLGETGAGKSTTCSLLMRFYEPTYGKILVNGEDYREWSLNSLRSRVGWVSQEVILFSDTLRENIRFYDHRISNDEIWKVLEWVQLKSWVAELPHKLDEMVSERGQTISTGQRQLLSLARALVKKPQILIFDEATASIDSFTEAQIQQALEKLWASPEFQNVTGFFIAHRLSTLKRCDRMLVFRNGEIVEHGTYPDLMSQKGYAYQLFQTHAHWQV